MPKEPQGLIRWTGGISNREVFMDSLRGLAVFVAVGFSLFAFAWWITGYFPFPNPNWRAPLCAGIAGPLASFIGRWCRA
jgi:hypothetical protein